MVKELEESCLNPGYFYYPLNTTFVVSKCGVVINEPCEEVVDIFLGSGGYLFASGVGHLHRILMVTFNYREDHEQLDVNHKDGNKANPDLSNLEWTTRSENCLHAYESGLRKDNTPILVKDLRDETIIRFYSLQACARHFGVGGSRIHQMLNPNNFGMVVFNYYVMVREGSDWPPTTVLDIGKYRSGRPRPVVVDSGVGLKMAYKSLSEASKATGVGKLRIAKVAWLEEPPVLDGYIFKYVLEIPNRIGRRSPNQGGARRKPVPVKVTHPDGTESSWNSTEDFALSVGTNKNAVQKSLGRLGHWKGYKVRYV